MIELLGKHKYLILKDGSEYKAVLIEQHNEFDKSPETSYVLTKSQTHLEDLIDDLCATHNIKKGSLHYSNEIKTFPLSSIINFNKNVDDARRGGCTAYCLDDGKYLNSKNEKRCDGCYIDSIKK